MRNVLFSNIKTRIPHWELIGTDRDQMGQTRDMVKSQTQNVLKSDHFCPIWYQSDAILSQSDFPVSKTISAQLTC